MINLSLLACRRSSYPIITIIMVGLISSSLFLSSPSSAFPFQRRPVGIVDRLFRPFRALANLFNRKFSMDLPYTPHIQQMLHPYAPILASVPNSGTLASIPMVPMTGHTHYVKMPTSVQPLYYSSPPVGMTSTSAVAMIAPVTRQPAQLPQKYLLHGISYPVVSFPQSSSPPQPVMVQPVISTYNQAHTQPVQHHQSSQQVIQIQQQLPFQIPQPVSNIVEFPQQNYLHTVSSPSASSFKSSVSAPADSSFGQVESPPSFLPSNYHHLTDQSTETPLSLENSSGESSLQIQLPPPIEYPLNIANDDKNIGSSSSENRQQSFKIMVIRPSDYQKMKELDEEMSGMEISRPSPDIVKGYSMKYIDVDSNGESQEKSVSSQIQVAPLVSSGDLIEDKESCIEPMCDPFLRKLIPELLASSTSFQNDFSNKENEPIVIVKSDNETGIPSDYSLSILPNTHNHKLLGSNIDGDDEPITLIRSVEQSTTTVDPMLTEQSSVRPKRVYFPRKKLISAKINSTSIRKFEPRSKLQNPVKFHKFVRNHPLKTIVSTATSTSSVTSDSSAVVEGTEGGEKPLKNLNYGQKLFPKPRIFEVEKSSPYVRYGSRAAAATLKIMSRKEKREDKTSLLRQLNNKNKFNSSSKTHYHKTAGVVFNKKSLTDDDDNYDKPDDVHVDAVEGVTYL